MEAVMNNRSKHSGSLAMVVAGVVLGLSVASWFVQADDGNGSLVYPPGARIVGRSYSDWTARWWQYIFPIPAPVNPTNDTSGTACDVAQKGLVWFLAGSGLNAPVKRICTIDSGKRPIFSRSST
jgi:hypothetical protein